ncbi:MAG: hypothetical protein QG567_2490 [Campylobacterota bacterium]|nr:hypothetical protein [Campylobacterota bacterium]
MNIVESYEVSGKLYITAKFLSVYFNKSAKQVSRWKQDGMPIADKPKELNTRGEVFILQDCIEWVAKNINSTKSRATQKRVDTSAPPHDDEIEEAVNDIQGKIKQASQMLQLKTTTHDGADRIKKILDGLIQAVKLGEQTKDLIPKRDTEKVIIEFVVTLIAGYKRDIKILPRELAKRDENAIRNILENNYKSHIEKYQKMTKSEIVMENKLYDVVEVVFEMIEDGVDIDAIMDKLK